MDFKIEPISNPQLEQTLLHKINTKTKPIGALGTLEDVAFQIGKIQQTHEPKLKQPTIIVFAGDHGIAKQGEVNPYPQEVTAQMVYNFLNGGAAINVFCKQHQIDLKIVDAGVNHNFETSNGLINSKIAMGTKNYQDAPAMSIEEYHKAITTGSELVKDTFKKGCNSIGFGEMGIGNTSSASLLMSYFTNISIEECVGSGTGLDDNAIVKKQNILSQVFNQNTITSPEEALTHYGGFEIVMMVGAILKAAALKMTIIIDGFIVTAALLAAHALDKNVLDYCIFAHTSGEQGHQKMLTFLNKKPLLNLGMRLGEGTGTAVAFPIIASAVAFLNDMASFESADVSKSK